MQGAVNSVETPKSRAPDSIIRHRHHGQLLADQPEGIPKLVSFKRQQRNDAVVWPVSLARWCWLRVGEGLVMAGVAACHAYLAYWTDAIVITGRTVVY